MGMHIDQINKDNHPYHSSKYHFPTIDFKFQNAGHATAVLWQFAIEILLAEVDQTPVLDFEVQFENGELHIEMSNHGWGAAYECEIQLNEPTLNNLFAETSRYYTGTIESGKKQKIICLTKEQMNVDHFRAISQKIANRKIVDYCARSTVHHIKRVKPYLSQKTSIGKEFFHFHWDIDTFINFAVRDKQDLTSDFDGRRYPQKFGPYSSLIPTDIDESNWREQAHEVLSEVAKGEYREEIDAVLQSMHPLIKDIDDPNRREQMHQTLLEYLLPSHSSTRLSASHMEYFLIIEDPQLEITWKCKDSRVAQLEGRVVLPLKLSMLLLTENGFYRQNLSFPQFHPCMGNMTSSSTYVSLIDPLKGPHDRLYPLSRKIISGDVERFHIMIGSFMSCHLSMQFKFFIDKETVSESEVFDIKIWNPRNSNWHENYEDGAELDRDLNAFLQALAHEGCWREESGVETLLAMNNYPFQFDFSTVDIEELEERERVYSAALDIEELAPKERERVYGAAILALEQMAKRVANREIFHYCKGHCLEHMKRYKEAFHEYKIAISLNPHLIQAWKHMGHCFRKLHRYEKALQAYQKTVSLDPKQTYTWYRIGECLQKLYRYEEALRVYEKIASYRDTWYQRGQCLQKLHRYEEALQTYEHASQYSSDYVASSYPDIWYQRGQCLQRLHRYEEALQTYERVSQSSPNYNTLQQEKRKILQLLAKSQEQPEQEQNARQHVEVVRRKVSHPVIHSLRQFFHWLLASFIDLRKKN